MTTWRDVCATIRDIVSDDLDDGTLDRNDRDSWDDYANEWADGSEWVIYYSESRALWADPATPDCEDEARELVAPDADIQERITAAAYCAVRAQILDTIRELADDDDTDDDDGGE